MPVITPDILKEKSFQGLTKDYLIEENEYLESFNKGYDRNYAIDIDMLFSFLENTQKKKIDKLKDIYGPKYKEKILYNIDKELKRRGSIDVIKHGVKDFGVKLQLAYFKPPTNLNPDQYLLYQKNILSVTEELVYDINKKDRIDLVIFLNGIPIITMELKNSFTGQTYKDAIKQYKSDRSNKEQLFKFKERIDNDSHNIDLLNKNYFWIKGSKINFRMLKEAFIDFDISIEYKYKPFSKKYIKGIYIQHTDDGFLTNGEINEGPFCIKFSDSLNAFIGGRGTGKSTILEFMDYIMGQNCRTEKLLDFLCNHGNAYILYVDNKKEYIIELLTPSKKNEHILQLFGQNHENKYHYRYHYDIEEIKERTLKTYINIYVLEYRKKEAPYFTPVTNKRK
ncbi:MAG: hypothetical protein H0S78_11590, partial [Tissierellales bacterium]|nr:hypothetical protein [Tissierellales bacterium]